MKQTVERAVVGAAVGGWARRRYPVARAGPTGIQTQLDLGLRSRW